MTAVTSSKSRNFFGTRFRNDITANKRQLIINGILQLLGLPVISISFLVAMYYDTKVDNMRVYDQIEATTATFAIVGIIAFVISLFMGMPIVLSMFSYLYKKTIADMHYALPLSGKQRFFADYLAGISIYAVPYVCAFVLSIGIIGIGSIFVDTSYFWSVFPSVLKLALLVLTAMIQFYTLSAFALSFCGNTFESSFSILAFNGMIPATIVCLWLAICDSSTYGVTKDSIFMSNLFTSSSPAGAVMFFANYAPEASYRYNGAFNEFTPLYTKFIIFSLIATAVYLGAGYFLYKFRKAESVSKPYVYKAFFYVIMSMVVFCILSLFISNNGVISAGILLCAIIWFIMEVITRRGFKKFWQAGIGFAASVAAVFLICQICSLTNGFGMSRRVPAPATVSSVTVRCSRLPNGCYDIKFHDKDVINAAIQLQEECIDRHFNPDNYSYQKAGSHDGYSKTMDCFVKLNYSLISGSNMRREYFINDGMTDQLIKAILLSDEYASAASEFITIDAIYGNVRSKALEINDKSFSSNITKTISATEEKLIMIAYESDLKAMTEDELINGSVYCYLDDKWVLDSFTATKDMLSDLGVNFENKDYSGFSDKNTLAIKVNPVFITSGKYQFEKTNYEYIGSDDFFIADTITSVRYGYANSATDDRSMITVPDKYISQVINNAYPIIIGEKPLASVAINEKELYLRDTEENRKLIAEIQNN
ncbi:MAG: hypothetical protein K2I00_00640 [Ruminococcus sp.]|nr:hypothetical protein [Ruminococcus sp.]